jgi:hypothetical protein
MIIEVCGVIGSSADHQGNCHKLKQGYYCED